MQIAGGVLGWSEQQFWSCSLPYFIASLEGYQEANGGGATTQKSDEEALASYQETKRDQAAYLNMSDDDLSQLRAENAAQ